MNLCTKYESIFQSCRKWLAYNADVIPYEFDVREIVSVRGTDLDEPYIEDAMLAALEDRNYVRLSLTRWQRSAPMNEARRTLLRLRFDSVDEEQMLDMIIDKAVDASEENNVYKFIFADGSELHLMYRDNVVLAYFRATDSTAEADAAAAAAEAAREEKMRMLEEMAAKEPPREVYEPRVPLRDQHENTPSWWVF